ncbi:MAG: EpsI family protein [bacterium]|nr:MAG: EpsI family protein [bacterium]
MIKARALILFVILAVLTAYTYTLRYRYVNPTEPPTLDLIPTSIGEYRSSNKHLDPASLGVLGADEAILRAYYGNEKRTFWMFLGYFSIQQENSQIHSPKHCYPGSGWNILGERTTPIQPAGNGNSRPVKELEISNGQERRIVLYWFGTRSGVIKDEFALKWHQMKNSLLGREQSAAFMRFSTQVRPYEDSGTARDELVAFVEEIVPMIEKVLFADAHPVGGE